MHKIVNGDAPSYLTEVLPQKVADNTDYVLRNRDNILQFRTRTEKFRKSFFPDCIRLWNNLDDNIKHLDDLTLFKNALPNVSTKSQMLFNYGERKLNIIHAQLRLQCSNLKAHLVSLHVDNDPRCHCNLDIEDNSHFLIHCPLSNIQRQRLQDIVQQFSRFELDVLLFGDDSLQLNENMIIFSAVHAYPKDSGRFVT